MDEVAEKLQDALTIISLLENDMELMTPGPTVCGILEL